MLIKKSGFYKAKLSLILLVWFLNASCSAQQDAPEDQIIEGPFTITTEWQEFKLAKPLKTNPHIQALEILLDQNSYIYDDNIDFGDKGIITGGYKRLSDSNPLRPEIILVDNLGKEFKPLYKSVGTSFTPIGNYKSLGFGANSMQGKFYYPPETQFVAIKIRANTTFTAKHFWWVAIRYEQAPASKWEDISPTEITYQ